MEENYYYHSFNEELFRLAVKQYFVASIYLFLSFIYLQLVLCFVRDKCIYDITLLKDKFWPPAAVAVNVQSWLHANSRYTPSKRIKIEALVKRKKLLIKCFTNMLECS